MIKKNRDRCDLKRGPRGNYLTLLDDPYVYLAVSRLNRKA